jgi:hypothetical protein
MSIANDLFNLDIFIKNDNYNITETNYWETTIAKKGLFFMSLNDGFYRLLVPETHENIVQEVLHASRVIITRGSAPQLDPPRPDAFEIVFEDGTDSPYAILMTPDYWDRFPSNEDLGHKGTLAIYCNKSNQPKLLFDKVFYRRADTLPCFDPIPEQVRAYDDPANWEYD